MLDPLEAKEVAEFYGACVAPGPEGQRQEDRWDLGH